MIGFDISSTEQIARITSERQAGVGNADVAYISDAPVVYTQLFTAGHLKPYVPADVRAKVPVEYQRPLLANRLSTKRSDEHTSELQSLMRTSYTVFCLKQ